MFAALFLHLWRLILLGGLVLLFWGTGAKVLRKFNFKFQTFSEEFIFGFAIGAIGWSFLIYFLGLVGLAQEIYFRFVFVVGLILVIPEINNFIDRTAKIFKSFQKQFSWRRLFQNQNYWFLLIIILILLAVVINLLAALMPEHIGDGIFYHLGELVVFLKQHRINRLFEPAQYSWMSLMPKLTEMLYLLGVSLGQDVLAKLIHWFLGIILAYSVFIFGRRFFNVRVGILAAGLIYITPLVSWLSSTAYIDLTTAFFSFLSFYTLLIWFWKKNLRWLIMAAILAAAAIGTKWLALVILFPQLFLLIWGWRHQRKRFWSAIKELLIFAGIIILATLPWTLFAYYYTHNPIYPVFGLKMLPEEWTDWGRYDLFKISPPANYFQYFSQKIWRLWPLLAEQFIFRLQPVMLIFIIGIFTWRKLDYKIKLMIVVGAVYFLAWSLIPIHEPRYFLPVMVWLIVPAAAIWLNFFSRRKSLLIFSFIFVILIMLRNINSSWNQNQKYLTYIIGRHTPQDFLQKEGLRKWYVPDYFYFQGKEK